MDADESGQIKSAFEKAMERVQRLEPPSKEKKLEWKGVPAGNRLAAEHLRGKGDLAAAIQTSEAELRPYILRGALEVLAANLQLPTSAGAEQATGRALAGARAILRGKRQIEEIIGRVQYVCEQYKGFGQQQRQQTREQLKQQFAAQLQEAVRQRTGSMGQVSVNVESLPEFQQEWLRLKARLDQQYEQHLEAFRQEIKALA